MARTKLQRLLPRLPSRSVLHAKENNSGDLLAILRTTAVAAQGTDSKAFYSLREVAQHFHVPLSTVARTYNSLENENLISRIRGSRTILQGTAPTRHLIVRSVVGMPASFSRFLTLQDYRMCFSKVRRELRRRGLLTAIVFYENQADARELAERIRQTRADVVLWNLPDGVARRTTPWLRDLGIRTVGIGDGGLPSFPCRYEVRRDTAIRAILKDWIGAGIRNVRVARGEWRSSANEERLEVLLAETPLSWRFVGPASGSTENFLARLSTHKDRAVIVSASAAAFFFMRAPEAFNRMLHNCRVAFLGGPVSMPLTPPPAVFLDLVVVDWQAVARGIADDMLSGEAFTQGKLIVFEAAAELKARLDNFAQKI